MGRTGIGVAVIEFGDGARTDGLAKGAETAGAFRNSHRQDRFITFTQLGALGDVAQAVEIHIGTAVDGYQALIADAFPLHVALKSGDAQCTGRFGNGAGIVEDILDRGTDLIGVDQDHLIHALSGDAERLFTDLPHRDTIGEYAHLIQQHPLVALHGALQGRRVFRFHADDLDLGIEGLDETRHSGDQTAAAHRHEDGVQRCLVLTQDLHGHRPLSGNDLRIIVRMDEDHALFFGQGDCPPIGIIVGIAM